MFVCVKKKEKKKKSYKSGRLFKTVLSLNSRIFRKK